MTDINEARQRPPIPIEYAGQWIAWDANRQRIVASGADYGAARDAALSAGERDPILQKVPHRKVRSILATWLVR